MLRLNTWDVFPLFKEEGVCLLSDGRLFRVAILPGFSDFFEFVRIRKISQKFQDKVNHGHILSESLGGGIESRMVSL